jgi:hypothetical protein
MVKCVGRTDHLTVGAELHQGDRHGTDVHAEVGAAGGSGSHRSLPKRKYGSVR